MAIVHKIKFPPRDSAGALTPGPGLDQVICSPVVTKQAHSILSCGHPMVILDLFLCFRATTNSKIPIHNKLLQQSGDMPTGTVGGSGGGQLAPFDPHPSCCRGGRGVRHRLLSSQGGQVHLHQLHLRPDLCHVGYQPQLCYCPRSKQCALFRYKMWIRVYGCDIQDSPFLVRLCL